MVRDRYGRILFFVGDGSISARGSGRTHLSAPKMGADRHGARARLGIRSP